MKIYIGADHRGFELKEKVKGWLKNWGYEFEDLGADKLDPSDDYTRYAQNVAAAVGGDETAKGILLCGSGMGVEIVANKIDRVRAGMGKSAEHIKMGRTDDDINVLVLAADFTTAKEAEEMTRAFLQTQFTGEERHKRRLDDIKKIEESN